MIETTLHQATKAHKVKILVVDDDQANLKAFEAILDGPDRMVMTARTGEEALRILLHDDVAAILLDVNMPGIDGYETARLIRAREKNRDTPIILVTAHRRDELDIEKGYALGAVDYLFRPVAATIVKAKVNCFVALAKHRTLMGQEERRDRRSGEHLALPQDTRVLIVDDDPALLEALPVSLQLRIPSLQMDLCESPQDAVERLGTFSYGAILADIKMPNQDGFALLREAQAHQPLTPVLLMTGHTESSLTTRAIDAGAFACLQKPFQRDEVAAIIKRALELYSHRRRQADLQRLLKPLVTQVTELENLGLVMAGEMDRTALPLDSMRLEKMKHLMQDILVLLQSESELVRQLADVARA